MIHMANVTRIGKLLFFANVLNVDTWLEGGSKYVRVIWEIRSHRLCQIFLSQWLLVRASLLEQGYSLDDWHFLDMRLFLIKAWNCRRCPIANIFFSNLACCTWIILLGWRYRGSFAVKLRLTCTFNVSQDLTVLKAYGNTLWNLKFTAGDERRVWVFVSIHIGLQVFWHVSIAWEVRPCRV